MTRKYHCSRPLRGITSTARGELVRLLALVRDEKARYSHSTPGRVFHPHHSRNGGLVRRDAPTQSPIMAGDCHAHEPGMQAPFEYAILCARRSILEHEPPHSVPRFRRDAGNGRLRRTPCPLVRSSADSSSSISCARIAHRCDPRHDTADLLPLIWCVRSTRDRGGHSRRQRSNAALLYEPTA